MVLFETIARTFISLLDTIKLDGFKAWLNNKENLKTTPAGALYRAIQNDDKAREFFIAFASTDFIVNLLECFRDKEVRDWMFSDKNYNEFVDYVKSIHDQIKRFK